MDNYLLKIIKDTTEYIETNIFEPLNLDCISDNVNISKFHLLRMWKGATSTGLMEYVRRRRIALSLADLLNRSNSMEFVSCKYSFGSERTYNRIFKDEFGTTPAKWRKAPFPLRILDRFNADFMNMTGDGLVFHRSTVILPAFSIAGPEYIIDSHDNMANQTANKFGVDFFYNHRSRVINPVEKDVYIGFTHVPETFEGCTLNQSSVITQYQPSVKDRRKPSIKSRHKPSARTLYQPSVKINQNSIVPAGMKARYIKPHKYGVFTYMGPHRPEEISSRTLSGLWQYIHEKWIPTVSFDLDEYFHFEQINYAKCNKHYCECDIYCPISKL